MKKNFFKEFSFIPWWMRIQRFLFWIVFIGIGTFSFFVWWVYMYTIESNDFGMKDVATYQKNTVLKEDDLRRFIDNIAERKERYAAEFLVERDIFYDRSGY